LLVVERAGLRVDLRRQAEHACIVDQGGQQGIVRPAAQLRVVTDDTTDDARRCQSVAGNEVCGAARIAFEKVQRAAFLSLVPYFIGKLQERSLVEYLAGVQGREQFDQARHLSGLLSLPTDARRQRQKPSADDIEDGLQSFAEAQLGAGCVGEKRDHAQGGIGQGNGLAVQSGERSMTIEQGCYRRAICISLLEGIRELAKAKEQAPPTFQYPTSARRQLARQKRSFITTGRPRQRPQHTINLGVVIVAVGDELLEAREPASAADGRGLLDEGDRRRACFVGQALRLLQPLPQRLDLAQ
jgi:hypothetical protein